MFKTPPFEVCSLMAGTSKLNAFHKVFLSNALQVAPQIFHKCPYAGLHSAKNIKFSKEFLTFLPKGTFKIKAVASDEANHEIFRYAMDFEIF